MRSLCYIKKFDSIYILVIILYIVRITISISANIFFNMDYLNSFKTSFKYKNRTFYRYNHHNYIGYEIKIKNITELDKMIFEYKKCHWVVEIYPPSNCNFKFVDSSNDPEICPICYSTKLNIKTICSHSFHLKCLEGWLQIKPECPVCRNALMPCNELYKVTFEFDLNNMKDIIENGSLKALSIIMDMCSDNSLRKKLEESKIRKMLNVEIRFIPFI